MKKIINGRTYNMSTAIRVADYDECLSRSDFGFRREVLYQKRNGEFFLYGEGGASTRWAQPISGNGWREGYGIVPLSRKGALNWASEHSDVETVERIFGEVSE